MRYNSVRFAGCYQHSMALAHSANSRGITHDLADHLASVARLAAERAEKLGARELGYWAGLWHDLGKFNPAFQDYLVHPETGRGPDHKGAGALLASGFCGPLALVMKGHHGGLPSPTEQKVSLREGATGLKCGNRAPCNGHGFTCSRVLDPLLQSAALD